MSLETHLPLRGHRDFSILWTGRAVNQLGTAVGSVALPVLAVTVLHASPLQVSLLSAVSTLTVLLLSFPVGLYAEHRRKRPVMIAADLVRFSALASVAVLGYLDLLTLGVLYAVSFVNGACQIAFMSASQAHVKALVGPDRLADAHGKLQSTTWLSISVGPSLGGLLVSALGALTGYLVHAVSFLAAALSLPLLRQPEPEPPKPDRGGYREELLAGLRCPWYFLIPLAVPGYAGVVIVCVGFGGQLVFAALANATMSTYRQSVTPDDLMTRVGSLWSFATTALQPLFIVAGGVLATAVGNRPTLAVAATLMAGATLLLPRR
ncbi:MFS transporter [Salininema proteolyticum]|uniref:MFS transporter n=1 Tax=Salininema proteolyticum TaxID=1607685 RepID=A0ABV8TXY8_9ACTN